MLEDGTVKIYSRNSEDNTGKYPDIIAMFPHVLEDGVKSIVMDAEAVAYDPEQNKILPFQVLSTRARKSVTVDNVKVHVCVYAFDCLYLNGEALLKKSLTERRDALYKSVKQTACKMELATAKTSNDVEELSKFLDDSVGRCFRYCRCCRCCRYCVGLVGGGDGGGDGDPRTRGAAPTTSLHSCSSAERATREDPRSGPHNVSPFLFLGREAHSLTHARSLSRTPGRARDGGTDRQDAGRLVRAVQEVEPLAQAQEGLPRGLRRYL